MIDLHFDRVSKIYRVPQESGDEGGHHGLARRAWQRVMRRKHDFWALRDVSFEVRRGEALGIIGHNGAGKSTILKLLSNITAPTAGEITINGRLSALIEVGSGFHPELTGRENVYLSGSILGMRRREIARKLESIIEFAGVRQFIDTPVKRYSSGMYVRLGFAIAAHLDPDILLLDEVLAVGDANFQTKCIQRIHELKKTGTTIVFISHDLRAVGRLCDRLLLMQRGTIAKEGSPAEVIAAYQESASAAVHSRAKSLRPAAPREPNGFHKEAAKKKTFDTLHCNDELSFVAPASDVKPHVTKVELRTSEADNLQRCGDPMELRIEISNPVPIKGARVSVWACDPLQQLTFYLWTFDSEREMCRQAGTYRLTCRIPKLRLYLGSYTLKVSLAEYHGGKHFEQIDGVCPFEVFIDAEREGGWYPELGVYIEDCEWSVAAIDSPRNSPVEVPDEITVN